MNVILCTNFLYGDFKGQDSGSRGWCTNCCGSLITECRQMYVGRGILSGMSKDFFGQI